MSIEPEEIEEIVEGIQRAIKTTGSPWADRRGAAAYCYCSPTTIDAAANRGDIKRYWRDGTPMFKKYGGEGSLDYWIEHSPTPEFRLRRMGAPIENH